MRRFSQCMRRVAVNVAETKPRAGVCPQSTGQITYAISYKPDRAASKQLHRDARKRLAGHPRRRRGEMLKLLAQYDRFETKARAAKRRAKRKLRNRLLSLAVAIAVVTLGVGLGSFYMNVQGASSLAEASSDQAAETMEAVRFKVSDLPAPVKGDRIIPARGAAVAQR